VEGIPSGSWGYNSDDEVSSESYDANGNVTATGGKSFTYDSENHLMSMTASGTSATIVYDGDGNRVAKTVNGVTTLYLVDDLNPTGYPQVMEELNGAGAVTRTYTYGLQRISEDQIVNSTWTPSFYGYDGGGNVRQLTNAAGAVTDSYEYDAFGNSFTVSGTTPNEFLYRGEQYNPDLGLYYLRARYYNPLTGRFMSRDPEDGNHFDPKSLHKYLYADGDPVNGLDPRGREDLLEYAGEFTDKLDKYNQFADPNDLAACLRKLFVSTGNAIFSIESEPAGASASLTEQVGNCGIELLWGQINPFPTHAPWSPWQD
jgi:RHS repeat-associated protein